MKKHTQKQEQEKNEGVNVKNVTKRIADIMKSYDCAKDKDGRRAHEVVVSLRSVKERAGFIAMRDAYRDGMKGREVEAVELLCVVLDEC